MTVGGIGMSLPSPGGAGSFHYATIQTLMLLFGVSVAPAASYALLVHAAGIVFYSRVRRRRPWPQGHTLGTLTAGPGRSCMTRTTLDHVAGVGGALLVAVLVARESGVIGSRSRVRLDDATASTLDTVAVARAAVTASLGGVVVQLGPGDRVWLDTGRDAVALRFDDEPGLAVEDRVLRDRPRAGAPGCTVADVDA